MMATKQPRGRPRPRHFSCGRIRERRVAEIVVRGEIDPARSSELSVTPLAAELIECRRPAVEQIHAGQGVGIGRPMDWNNAASASLSGLPAVSSLSPKKTESAPARKQRI